MKLSSKIFIGFALVIFLSIIDTAVNYKLSKEVNRNTTFLASSESIIRNSSKLHKSIIEMQSGFRGYLLSDNENFLAPFFEGLKEIPILFKVEKALIRGSSKQMVKLDSIEDLHKSWIRYANSLIEAKKMSVHSVEGKNIYKELFEKKLQKEVGKKINDEIKIKFIEFDKLEYAVRKKRRELLSASIQSTHTISLSLAFFTILVALMAAVYIARIISRRIFSMVNLAEGISQGEFKAIEDSENDELTDLSKSLNVMSQKLDKSFTELEKKNKELDQFAYVVSHDLKAPLRGMYNILIWIEEDLSHELSQELKSYLEKLRGRILRLENLINGLLAYAKIGRTAKILEQVDTNELLKEITEMIVPSNFNITIQEGMPVILTEKIRLQQVFSNLISNAVKYNNSDRGEIFIKCQDLEKHYEFSIVDNGVGIASEFHERIFGIFQTLREKDQVESTGVGLAIVKKTIEDQKGFIKLNSESGKGTEFIFTWPKEPDKESK